MRFPGLKGVGLVYVKLVIVFNIYCLSPELKEGKFSGDEDEKLPSIASLRKRGYTREAFVKFVIQRGISEVDKLISSKDFFKVLDQFNK